MHDINSANARDNMKKAKIKWAIEGDENSKFFHGIINRKRANLAIKGVMADGEWVDDPYRVKEELRLHFANRFRAPGVTRYKLNYTFPNKLSLDQVGILESMVSKDEVRDAIWGCGENKSPGPDGFSFEFFRKFWDIVGSDLFEAVKWFFDYSSFPRGCNSSFIALISKNQDPKFVNDYRPISLIGSLYKVVTKILANRLSMVISDLISNVQTAFLPNRQIQDGPFIINELLSCGCLNSGMASVILNGSPSVEFQFYCGLKQGDPLEPYLFLLVMESLHLSVSKAIEARIFKGIKIDSSFNLSHLFYADDAVFIGEWSSSNFSAPFKYLGVMVGGNCSSFQAWEDVIGKLKARLSNWKLKTLSVGGRLTLLKSVLGSAPIYNLSIYKASKRVLHAMESLRRNFFNGVQSNERKIAWVKWTTILASKKNGGLGISSLYALNRALLFNVFGDSNKDCSVAMKLLSSTTSLRRPVRGGAESLQLSLLNEFIRGTSLSSMKDRWIKYVPIKVNILAWKVHLDRLPTRANLQHRGVLISDSLCPICCSEDKDSAHMFFRCSLATNVSRLVCRK
nr:hypothetical protein [Tanacetum cinerariifolium]